MRYVDALEERVSALERLLATSGGGSSGGGGATSIVVDLPPSPSNGQEVIYRVPVTIRSVATEPITNKQAAVLWHLRWMEGTIASVDDDGPAAGRWEFLGGGSINRYSSTGIDIGTGGDVPLSTYHVDSAVQVKPPLPGMYELVMGAKWVSGAGNVTSAEIRLVRGDGTTWETSFWRFGDPALEFRISSVQVFPTEFTTTLDNSGLQSDELLAIALRSSGPDWFTTQGRYLRLRPIWVVPFS